MKAIMYPAISLDGFIAKPDGDSSSWVDQTGEALYEIQVERCGCVLVGRKTYEEYIDDFRSKKDKDVVVFVCSRQLGNTHEENIKFVSGSPPEILRIIEKQGFSEVIVCGGGEINGLFAMAGLVDEIIISVQPVVLGEGIRLFGSHQPALNLQLLSTNQTVPGVVQNHYKVLSRQN